MYPSQYELADRTWTSVPRDLLLLPLGSLEQHGPHLPLATDTAIAAAVARRLYAHAESIGIAASVGPALPYGASGEHEGFDGTISIGTEALARVVIELGRSASRWARRIVFVNAHGGNVDALREAVPQLRSEGSDASWIACAAGPDVPMPDPHAGRHETALLLSIAPDAVRLEHAAPGDTRPLNEILPQLREGGVAGVSPNGVLGDPLGATAELGERLLQSITARAWIALTCDHVSPDGRRTGRADVVAS